MRRTMTGMIMISVFILSVVIFDFWFMTDYAKEMNELLDELEIAEAFEERKEAAGNLDQFFEERNFWAHRLVPTGRLDELDALLHKLNSYISTNDEHEVAATISEIRSKVNSLYSTTFYHWYHRPEFRIE